MGVTVEKLREVNEKLRDFIKKKKEISSIEIDTAEISIDDEDLTSQKSLLEELPKELVSSLNLNSSTNYLRIKNLIKLISLYNELEIFKKAPEIDKIFQFKAMNISGIGLKEDDFGEIRSGKYVQIIAITYEPDKNGKKRAKNVSLGYFGKAETLTQEQKNKIIEFVLRWRYEKAYQNLEHYQLLLDKLVS